MISFNFNQLNQFKKIFVLVSGGIDSTYLYETIKEIFPSKTYPVNCYNPYEQNETLKEISKDPKFIQIKPGKEFSYKNILKNAFLKLPEAYKLKKQKSYHKKIFPCCYYIKHKMFLNHPLFKLKNTVVISGIKRGDGQQRFFWLNKLKNENTFFHKHKGGQLYCYPFRDYTKRELNDDLIDPLYKKYPHLKHTGCYLCPVLVLFDLKSEGKRYIDSVKYAQKLGVYPNKSLDDFL